MLLTNLKTKYLGKNAIYFETIDSTQNEIWRLYEDKTIPSGTLVMADYQTNGKGTHGRKWYTDQANNIAFSFLIRMDKNIRELDGLTIKVAEVIVEPNDLILNGKKLGGILTETKVIAERVKALVIGIGINIRQEEFADEIIDIATSIKKETGKEIDTKEFITEFCNKIEKYI